LYYYYLRTMSKLIKKQVNQQDKLFWGTKNKKKKRIEKDIKGLGLALDSLIAREYELGCLPLLYFIFLLRRQMICRPPYIFFLKKFNRKTLFVQADYALSVWPVLGNPNGQKLDRISPFIFLDKTTHFQLNFDLETYAKQHIQLNKPTYALKLAKKIG